MGYRLMFSEIIPYLPVLLKGLEISIRISIVSILIGPFIGVLASFGLESSVYIIKKMVNLYVEIFRNIPMLIQMYLLYFGLAQFNIQISPFMVAVLVLSLCLGAYSAVVFQAGINAVHKGQQEAAYSLGMTSFQTFRYVILPQAFRIIIPPLTNQFIRTFLASSVASTVSIQELTHTT